MVFLISFGFYESKSQNLISNGSFENLNMPINWSTWGGGFYDYSVFPEQQIVSNWMVFNSPDYFTSDYPYANQSYWQPLNVSGSSITKTGKAYAGIYIYKKSSPNDIKEYIYQNLATPLKQDSIYCLSFFTTRADRTPYAVKALGAYFSFNTPTTTPTGYINAVPQVLNTSGFLTDTVNWVEVKGCFTAQGGEQYVTIGNFSSNVNTDTLSIQSTNPLTGTGTDVAYYYIDSVSLWQNNFPTAINENSKSDILSVYPNPAKDEINFKFADAIEKRKIVFYDALGKVLLNQEANSNKLTLTTDNLPNGIYFYCILVNGININTNKIVIIK